MARALMFQGTGSSVGKSVLVAGLARVLTRRGLRVRPFKPQNMSNNAAVTADGGEIGRAQALQARACGVPPTVDMNPVLLKPQSDVGAQLVVRGKVQRAFQAKEYASIKPTLMPEVLDAFYGLADQADIVLVEGAGSASEINLRAHDIANMGFAQAADMDVVLVGDIDRGGVIASLVGTKTVCDKKDSNRIKGFIVNRMRGDPSLFADGMDFIADRTGWEALGLVPYCDAVRALPAEDAADLQTVSKRGARVRVVVPHMPCIANFDDLDPVNAMPAVDLLIVESGQSLPVCDLVILPGSKATISDLKFFRNQGWDVDLVGHVRRKGAVLGICGGYQMLGQLISDPDGVEGSMTETAGLGLLDVTTCLTSDKQLIEVEGLLLPENVPVSGYEIHMGRTTGAACERPFASIVGQNEGACSADGRIWGTYLHGVLSNGAARQALLNRIGLDTGSLRDHVEDVEEALDSWADHLEKHVDIGALLALARVVKRS
ncbi:cobyric acid synthase CobQ [Acetobacter aceti NRIC 0242]|uniref:Cobyric acid synthase n=1 Tax=Acetobacter aceti NBRC 14818 TaxID=887700 RepID=A0AB33IFB4_ACEAC|nr:cobyric acid synthase [Acetobacter aceti]TCS27378.1 adenosylcobyric acid synthase (glutamine-hydrolysing) [Acetobacter aceti NBRC 14818]BCK76723.1 cobyric acid synthase [Acetobacter aceti NBRC 14818]GAN58660.1 cobyric acid synthase CobQ [Acetobacter aceti NBRC 14818]GBO80584.1 cobyric acid synthase CobQ [Acetobacter aceti NRIC 0242]